MKASVIIICSLLIALSLPTIAYADGELGEIYDGLPSQLDGLFPEDFGESIKKDGTSAVKDLDASFILSFLGKALSVALHDTAPILLSLSATVMLSALLSSLSKNSSRSVGKALNFASGVSLCGACIAIIKPLSDQCFNTLNAISGIIKVSLPVMTAVSYAAGQVSSTTVNATFLNAFLMLTEEMGRNILSPLLTVSIAFSTVSTISRASDIDLTHIVGSIKKTFIFFISLLSSVLCLTMSFQTVIAKGSDTVLLRSIRFASGSAIPIVGASLSEAAGTYLSGLSLIKSSAGTLVAAAIALSALPMILKLFAVKLSLTFVAFVADILGIKGDCIRDFASIIDMMTAMIVTSSLIFVISMGIFASVVPSV